MSLSVGLANSVQVATIDRRDTEKVLKMNWFLASNGYVVANNVDGQVYLHRYLMGEPNCLVDHKDQNPLNNQRENLRLCTSSQNAANSGPKKGRKYKGVHLTKELTFKAQICVNRKQIHIGTFKTAVEAARAYNEMALKAWGEFAYLNPVNNGNP